MFFPEDFASIPDFMRVFRRPARVVLGLFLIDLWVCAPDSWAADISAHWNGSDGNWTNSAKWDIAPAYPNNGNGVTYDATINTGTVTLDQDITIQRLFLNQLIFPSVLTGDFDLTLNDGLTWSGGVISGTGHNLNLAVGSTSNISGSVNLVRTLNNFGTVTQSGAITLGSPFSPTGVINNAAGATYNLLNNATFNPGNGVVSGPGFIGQINNAGEFVIVPSGFPFNPGDYRDVRIATTFNNTGTVTVQTDLNGTYEAAFILGSSNGTFNVAADTLLSFAGSQAIVSSSSIYTLAGGSINGAGTTRSVAGTLAVTGNTVIHTAFSNEGTLAVESGATLSFDGDFVQPKPSQFFTPPTTRLNGGTIASSHVLEFQYGLLTGFGTLNANVNLGSDAAMLFNLGGAGAGAGANQHDSFTLSGSAALGGMLALTFKNGFESLISSSDNFVLLTATSGLNGAFNNVANGTRMDTTDGFGSFLVSYDSSTLSIGGYVPNTRWLGGNGNWSNATNWSSNPVFPNNGSTNYSVAIHTGTANLDTDVTVSRLFMTGGNISGSNSLTVNDRLLWTAGSIDGSAGSTINLGPASITTIALPVEQTGLDFRSLSRTLNNAGTVYQTAGLGASGAINNLATGTWNIQGADSLSNFSNAGSVVLQDAKIILSGGAASGSFTLLGQDDRLEFLSYTLLAGSTVSGNGSASVGVILNVNGDATINVPFSSGGFLKVQAGATLNLTNSVTFGEFGGSSSTILAGGTINPSQTTLVFPRGTLQGSGHINSSVQLGDPNYLLMQLGGMAPGSNLGNYDQIGVNGSATLGGALQLTFKNSFENSVNGSDAFTLLSTASPIAGAFYNVASGARLDTTDGFGSFLVNYSGSDLILSNFIPNTRWLGGNGNWTDSTKWSSNPAFPNNSGSTSYDADIHSGNVTLNTDIIVSRLLVTGGNLVGSNTLTVTKGLVWNAGSILGNAGSAINLEPGSTSVIDLIYPDSPTTDRTMDNRVLNNAGTVTQFSRIFSEQFSNPTAVINNLAGATWNVQGHERNFQPSFSGSSFNNSGSFIVGGGLLPTSMSMGAAFNNSGVMTLLESAQLSLGKGGSATGSFNLGSGSFLLFGDFSGFGFPAYSLNSGATITGPGTAEVVNGATVNIAGNATISSNLVVNGVINGSQGFSYSTGTLSGAGTINANLTNSGTISPGFSPATLTINGSLSLLSSSNIVMEIGGVQNTQFDRLVISGALALGGTLQLSLISDFIPTGDQTFTLATSNSAITGVFTNVASGSQLATTQGPSLYVYYGDGSPFGANNLVLSNAQIIPEPGSVFLFLSGLALSIAIRSRKR